VIGARLFLPIYLAAAALLFPQPELVEQYANTGVKLLDSGWEGLFLGVWQREDALWYEKIASAGYSSHDITAGYFPLYPMLMRLLSQVTGLHPVASGIVISEISLAIALFLLHRLICLRFGFDVADRTLVYICIFPSSFFLHAPFSESLTLMLAILGFFLISNGRWAEATIVAYFAGLCRPQGVLLGIPLAVQLLAGRKKFGQWRSFYWTPATLFRAIPISVAPFFGLATFGLLVDTPWLRGGFTGASGPMSHQSLSLPGVGLFNAAQQILAGAAHPIDIYDFVIAVAFIVFTISGFGKLDAGFSIYALLFIAPPLSRYSPVFPLMSFSRYALLLFPCFLVLATCGRSKIVHMAVIFFFIWWLAVWSAKFYTGYFVG